MNTKNSRSTVMDIHARDQMNRHPIHSLLALDEKWSLLPGHGDRLSSLLDQFHETTHLLQRVALRLEIRKCIKLTKITKEIL